jgi:hypothetical protein
MKPGVNCINCVFNRLLRAAKASIVTDKTVKIILFEASRLRPEIPEINLDLTTPEVIIKKALLLYLRMLKIIKKSSKLLTSTIPLLKLKFFNNSYE